MNREPEPLIDIEQGMAALDALESMLYRRDVSGMERVDRMLGYEDLDELDEEDFE